MLLMQTRFEQMAKEMAVFAQNNNTNYDKLVEFFLYELNLRCVAKDTLAEMAKQEDDKIDWDVPP